MCEVTPPAFMFRLLVPYGYMHGMYPDDRRHYNLAMGGQDYWRTQDRSNLSGCRRKDASGISHRTPGRRLFVLRHLSLYGLPAGQLLFRSSRGADYRRKAGFSTVLTEIEWTLLIWSSSVPAHLFPDDFATYRHWPIAAPSAAFAKADFRGCW